MSKAHFHSYIPTQSIGQEIDKMVSYFTNQRKSFERKWYDNNFFDDGYHFRYVSRTTGKIIDLNEAGSVNMPDRAIPKASRQIRGIANLMLGLEPIPVVYPEKVSPTQFPPRIEMDPQTGMPVQLPNPAYAEAMEVSKTHARRIGLWIAEEWKNQNLREKLIHMVILAAKHGVSFLQIWPDELEERIRTQVFDAFDIYLQGNVLELYESPAIIKVTPQLISQIKANERFDQEQLKLINPDNKYASSEIKQAYMQSRFGSGMESDAAATLLLKEAFIKEYLSEENIQIIGENFPHILENKKMGDMVMRHVFCAGGIYLLDEYVDLPEYPFVDFRFEPGAIYQKPLIENFIPANKSLDILVSRLEKWANTMVTGHWLKPKGTDIQFTNVGGGQVLEYTGTPPVQGQIANVPAGIFNLISFYERTVEEQGASTSALNQLPPGVRSGVAIESLKATEYANLKIASDMLKLTVKTISERMLDLADNYFIHPQTVMILDQGKPDYYDIMGNRGVELRRQAGIEIPENVIPLKKDYKVEIEVESGMGFTAEGRKATAQQIITFFTPLLDRGFVAPEAIRILAQHLLESFGFGGTQEIIEAMEEGMKKGPMTDEQLMKMKIAILETMSEAGMVGQQKDEADIQKSKIGTVEALDDLAKGETDEQQ
jgi:hypothetical protein